ncbi:MAG: glycosyltransferase family 39 protein [Terrimesophilobacter sp.]
MATFLLEHSDRDRPELGVVASTRPNSQAIRRLASLLGVTGFLVSFAGSWIPSLWGDEAASVMSAERSLPSLFDMVMHVDAVHGTYYLLLHFWVDLFGASPVSVRLPSALAVGFAVAGTVLLANELFSRRVATIAGILSVLLPRFTYMGAEARSYAWSAAAAVLLTYLIVKLVRARSSKKIAWIVYAVGLALGIYLFLYLALLIVVHGVYLLVSRPERHTIRRWTLATLLGVLLSTPIIVVAITQRHQIAFLAHRTRVTVAQIVSGQWFDGRWIDGHGVNSPVLGVSWLAVACWALIAVAVIAAARGHYRRIPMVLVGAWLVLPTVILLAGNAMLAPMYTNRYLSFCAPAAAILVAAGIAALPRRWMRGAAIVIVLSLVLPGYIAQRTEFGKPGGSDWAAVSAVIGHDARPGDAIVFDNSVKPSWRPRLAMHTYPEDYRGLNDVALLTPFEQTTGLWDSVEPLPQVASRLVGVSRVWALETKGTDQKSAGSDLRVLAADGFTVITEIPIHRTIVYELVRSSS